MRRVPLNVKRTVRSVPDVFSKARMARKPKVAAYRKAKSDGKLEPVRGLNTYTSSGEGRGRAITVPRSAPRTHIPVRLRMERNAARHPATPQERAEIKARMMKIQGDLAVCETTSAQFKLVGTRD